MPKTRTIDATLREILDAKAPESFSKLECARLEQLKSAARFALNGVFIQIAVLRTGQSLGKFYRLVRAFSEHGVEGLRLKYWRSGRRRKISKGLMRAICAHLALVAVHQEIVRRLHNEEGYCNSRMAPLGKIASASFLRQTGMTEPEFSELVMEEVLEGSKTNLPADLQPHVREIRRLARQLLGERHADGNTAPNNGPDAK